VNPTSLDHVALWVADRDAIADFAIAHLGMHVIERTDRFTLVGSNARRGKLTLFAAEGSRETGALAAIGLRVNDLERATAALPEGYATEFDVGEGLRIHLVEAETVVDYDLDHIALWTVDPEAAAKQWHALGFSPAAPVGDVLRAEVAGAFLELRPGEPRGDPTRPLLNHIAVLVDSAEKWREEAANMGAEIADVVDAPNTYAVFVWGPERVKLEYVEHKPGFSLE
jgi:catechol 2,3-dioxygenase-like lactoylglutathione lyase family enzyme